MKHSSRQPHNYRTFAMSDASPAERLPSPRYCPTVEPVLFLIFLAQTLSGAVLTNLFLLRTCEVTLGLNVTTCSEMERKASENSTVEALVQPRAATLQMYKSIVEAFIPATMSVFLGPWSDTHGRRPLILWPMLGYSLTYVMLLGLSSIPGLDPRYLLLTSIPLSFSGGFVSLITACYSYISDITTAGDRALRMGVVDAALFTGLFVGTMTSSYVYAAAGSYGYVAVFGTSAATCMLGFIYMMFVVEESLVQPGPLENAKSGLRGLFDWCLVKDMVRTFCQSRSSNARIIIFLLMTVLVSGIISFEGEGSVFFLFVREKFSWNIRDYTTFVGVGIVIVIAGMLLGLKVLSSWLKVPDAPLAVVAFLSKVVGSIVESLSPRGWYLYLGHGIGFLGGIYGPLCRSILSKTVPPNDLGKVFSMIASVEALAPLAAAPLYTLLYNATLVNFPGAFLLVSAAMYAVAALLTSVVALMQRRSPSPEYRPLHDTQVNEGPQNN